jgi:hypothetical protein
MKLRVSAVIFPLPRLEPTDKGRRSPSLVNENAYKSADFSIRSNKSAIP